MNRYAILNSEGSGELLQFIFQFPMPEDLEARMGHSRCTTQTAANIVRWSFTGVSLSDRPKTNRPSLGLRKSWRGSDVPRISNHAGLCSSKRFLVERTSDDSLTSTMRSVKAQVAANRLAPRAKDFWSVLVPAPSSPRSALCRVFAASTHSDWSADLSNGTTSNWLSLTNLVSCRTALPAESSACASRSRRMATCRNPSNSSMSAQIPEHATETLWPFELSSAREDPPGALRPGVVQAVDDLQNSHLSSVIRADIEELMDSGKWPSA